MPEKTPTTLPLGHKFAVRTLDAADIVIACVLGGVGAELVHMAHGRLFLLIVGGGLVLAALHLALRVFYHSWLDAVERWAQHDLDGDGSIGSERIIFTNRPARDTAADWRRFVDAAIVNSTVPALEAAGFTRMQIEAGRDALMAHNLAAWRTSDHRGGWTVTATADDVLRTVPYSPISDTDAV